MKTLNQYVIYIGKVIHCLGNISLASIIIMITFGIIWRYVFRDPLFWVEELASFFLVHLCYFSATVVTINHRHAAADFLIAKAPVKAQKAVSIIGSLIALVFFITVCVAIYNLLPGLVFTSPALGIPRKFFYFPVISMSAVMGFVLLVDILNTFATKQEQETLDKPQPRNAALE